MTTQANPANQDGVKTPADNNDGKVDKTPAPSGQDDKHAPHSDAGTTPSNQDVKNQEQMIPMSRFREVIDEKNKYKEDLDKRQKAEEKQKQKELEEKGQYQELLAQKDKELETAGKSKEQLTQYEETLGEILESELEKIPEDKKSLIPEELPVVACNKSIDRGHFW